MTRASPTLAPFLPTLDRSVEEAARGLLGLDAGGVIVLHVRRDPLVPGGIGALHVVISAGDARIELDLQDDDPVAPAWLRGGGLLVSHRTLPNSSESRDNLLIAQTLERIRGAVSELAPTDARVEALARALADKRRFRGVRDIHLRQLSGPVEGLLGATLRLGFRCNQDCDFCWQDRAWPEPPHALYEAWIDAFAASGVGLLDVSGGEPTVHRRLPEIIRRASQAGMRVRLETNALRLTRPGLLRTLVGAGLWGVFVSWHSADETLSDRLTRAPGTWRRTVEGIGACLDAGLHVSLNAVVDARTWSGLEAHARAVVDRFVAPREGTKVARVTYSHPTASFGDPTGTAWQVPFDLLRPALLGAASILRAAGVDVDLTGPCGFPRCLFRDEPGLLSNIDMDSRDLSDRDARRYVAPCEACTERSRCLGPRREYVEAFGDRDLEPFLHDRA